MINDINATKLQIKAKVTALQIEQQMILKYLQNAQELARIEAEVAKQEKEPSEGEAKG